MADNGHTLDQGGGATSEISQISRPAKVTRRNIAKIPERHLIQNIDPMLAEAFTALRVKIKDGNMQAIRLGMEIVNLVKAPGGINVSQNIFNQQNNNTDNRTAVSFESLVRRLDKRNVSASDVVIDATPD